MQTNFNGQIPRLFYQGCCAHGFDLIMEDIEKQQWIKSAFELRIDPHQLRPNQMLQSNKMVISDV